MAILIKSNQSEESIMPQNGKFSLEELQGFVGGYIECVSLPDGKLMIMNEEGKLEGLPYNEKATGFGILAGINYNDYVCGDVLICSPNELDHELE